MADRVGQQLGNYRLLRKIGQGAFAEVYLGEHQYLERLAAIKVLHVQMEPKTQEQFRREARTIAHLQHPHILQILEFGIDDQTPYLVMEYTPGGTLRSHHPKGTRLPLEEIVTYVKQLASALDYAHQQRVIHRDVKPDNLLLNAKDEIVLSNFGLAVVQRTLDSLSTHNPAGTPLYMAPEQIQHKPCAASDQYALGIMGYEWLTGDAPFRGPLFEVFSHHLYQPPPGLCERLSGLPVAVEEAVFKALAKDPAQRFASVTDFASALEQACDPAQPLTLHGFPKEQTPEPTVSSRTQFVPSSTVREQEDSSSLTQPMLVTRPPKEQVKEALPLSTTSPVTPPQTHSTQVKPSLVQSNRSAVPPHAASPRFWNIPYPRNPYFTGRDKLLIHLTSTMRAEQRVAVSQPQALSGLGGIGKTQIALEYAYRSRQDYQAVFWVRAETQESLISSFVALADLLELPQKTETDQQRVVEAVKAWLQTHNRWLLILDNADDLTLVRDFLPQVARGHVLLTTRAASMGRLASRLEVETLGQDQGALFLLRRVGMLAADASLDQAAPGDVALAQKLVWEMGGLPLALDQAGAYIEETQSDLAAYLQLYRQHRVALLKERGGLVPDHPEPVATTWSLSFQQVEQVNQAAADLLRVFAFLQPDEIPEEFVLEGGTQLGPHIQALAANPLAFNKAILALCAYSLIQRTAAEQLLSVHRLVQAVVQDAMTEHERVQWRQRAIQALNVVFPKEAEFVVYLGTYVMWKQCARLTPHVLACAAVTPEQTEDLELAAVLSRTANYLRDRGQYMEAEPLYQRALRIREQALGPEHPHVASLLTWLANLYHDQGRYAEAEPLYQRALRINEQVFGPEHLKVIYPLGNLANLYQMQKKYAEAEPLYQRALRIGEQALGPEHPHVAILFTNLARLYLNQKKYVEAEPLYQQALRIDEQVLGPEHPGVAYPLRGLAGLYQMQKKYVEAESSFQRALRIREQTIGPEHPLTVETRTAYARFLREMGRTDEAAILEVSGSEETARSKENARTDD